MCLETYTFYIGIPRMCSGVHIIAGRPLLAWMHACMHGVACSRRQTCLCLQVGDSQTAQDVVATQEQGNTEEKLKAAPLRQLADEVDMVRCAGGLLFSKHLAFFTLRMECTCC